MIKIQIKSSNGLLQNFKSGPYVFWMDFSFFFCCCCLVAKLCPILCDPMDCSPLGSSVHGILQARILEWVAITSSRGSSLPRDQIHVSYVSCIARHVLYHQHHLGSSLVSSFWDTIDMVKFMVSFSTVSLTNLAWLDQQVFLVLFWNITVHIINFINL